MAAGATTALYDEVIRVTHGYLGPASYRFVNRQIGTHLGKEPHKLRKKDLSGLIDWLGAAMALLTEDRVAVNRYMSELRSLAEN